MQKIEVPKEVQQMGVEIVEETSNKLLKDWKPKTVFGKVGKFLSKLAINIGVGITTKNINKQ